MEITTVSDDMSFQGEIQFDDMLVISGSVEGVLRGNGKAVVEGSGNVHGDLYVRQIDLKGKIQGNIHGSDSVHLSTGANVAGDIETRELHMERGSRHNGATIMK